jgi:hypothetical protein
MRIKLEDEKKTRRYRDIGKDTEEKIERFVIQQHFINKYALRAEWDYTWKMNDEGLFVITEEA